MFTPIEISLLIRLIIAHLLADFVFQADSWVDQRFKNGWHSKYLYLHGIIAGVLAYFFSGLWNLIWILAAVAVTHILIDGIKAKYENNIQSFLLDQLGHFMVILVIWILIISPGPEDIALLEQIFLPGINVWVIVAAYLIVIWPRRFLILTLVLLKQYEAIGLLVAAKSIFRFSASRSVGEYVLIGTLLSFTIAITVGLVASLFL